MENTKHQKTVIGILTLLAFVVVATVLKVGSSFLIPIVLSILLVFVMYPVCIKLNKIHVPWILCILLVLAAVAVVVIGMGGLIVTSIKNILEVYPRYEDRFNSIYQQICTTLNLPFDENSSIWTNLWSSLNVRSAVQSFAISFSGSLISFMKVFMIVFLFMIFLLLELNPKKSVSKIDQAFTNSTTRKKINNILSGTVTDVTRYLSIKFFISLITGGLVGAFCQLIGMDFAIIWGFLAFILNFIPNFGSLISWAVTTLFALLQFYPSIGRVIFIGVAVLAINIGLGSFLEPKWEGKDLGVSPFVILISLSFWGWMWGFVGMILAVPITVMLKIIFENYTLLRPIAIIIGNGKRKSSKQKNEQKKSDI